MPNPAPATGRPSFHGYDFAGPPGAFILTFGLPALVYLFLFSCNDVSGCPAPSLLSPSSLTLETFKKDIGWQGLPTIFNTEAFLATLGWYGLSLLLYAILPASESEGTVLRSGGRLKYRNNAFSSAAFTAVVLAGGTIAQGASFPVWTFISDNYIPLYTSNLIISYFLAIYVYISSFTIRSDNKDRELAAGGISGNVIYDFFIGRELNPRLKLPLMPEIDIKYFMEMRPGLLGWVVLDCAMIAQQYRNFGYVTDSMLITVISQTAYVFDGLYMEPAVLTTIDIVSDGFGFMLAFGDVAWLPFVYTLQARYLSIYPVQLGWYSLVTLGALATGLYIFRSSNNEKNRFRRNPNDPAIAHLKSMETKAGTKLLISGWWGTARHINYLGDWILSWAYCLPTGLAGYHIVRHQIMPVAIPDGGVPMLGAPGPTVVYQGDAMGWGMIITYFYMIYFSVLLIHRERRDEAKCRAKYGKDWEEYCKKVPWRIVPYIY